MPMPRIAACSLTRRSLVTSLGFNSICCARFSGFLKFQRAPRSNMSSVLATVANFGKSAGCSGRPWWPRKVGLTEAGEVYGAKDMGWAKRVSQVARAYRK